MLSYGSAEYIYNAQGSLTTKISGQDTTRYTYDLMGNLLAVSLPNGDEIEYLIDPQNRRVGKILNGVVVNKWIYQDQLNPVAELDGAGNLISRFVYGDKGHVPAYMEKAGVTYRIITNHLGSVRAVVNVATGEVVQEISYNEFGVVLENSNPDFQLFAYAGGLYDSQTGLVRFGARDYDCFTGRWTAKDPIGFGGGLNVYIYVNNAPISNIDPLGLNHSGYAVIVISQYASGVMKLADNYIEMKAVEKYMRKNGLEFDENFDKYFHCKGNCEAAKLGKHGKQAAKDFADNGWEAAQKIGIKLGLKHDETNQCAKDLKANKHGRDCPDNIPCDDWCGSKYGSANVNSYYNSR